MKKNVLILSFALLLSVFASCGKSPSPVVSSLPERKESVPLTAEKTGPLPPETQEDPGEAAARELSEKREEAIAFFDSFSGEEYTVGKGEKYSSFVSLLLDLKDNEKQKTVYLKEGAYDLFAEYLSEVKKGRIQIPPDSVASPDYFEPYNAFIPSNTRVIGLGEVTLSFTPSPDEISYGASRTWSPLNVKGNVFVENVTVIGQNCRYCLHNDDHNRYPGSFQFYRSVKLEYRLSGQNAEGKTLGFNNTVGFGIDLDAVHIFEDCEIFFNGEGNHSAFYGHNPSTPGKSFLLLKNTLIHASDEKNRRVVRLQTLSHRKEGRIVTVFDSCRTNGALLFHLYYEDSTQSFDVTFQNTPKMQILHDNRENGPVRDPYTVKVIG